MKVTIEGTKAELMELLAEIRRRDKEYITVPNYVYSPSTPHITNPYITTCETTSHSAYGERREPKGFTADEWYRDTFKGGEK